MQDFNLIDHPWIPVRWRTDTTGDTPLLVSLHDAFARSGEIADLDCAPHERIALTRLLVCITHAALGAPQDEDGWDDFADDLDSAVPAYLARSAIHPHFNFLGDGPRFLQENVPTGGDAVPASKLFPALATGNNPTLLDHSGMSPGRPFDPASIALALLAFQNFYPLYGAGYKGRGPCADGNAIHCLLIAHNLKQTIHANLIDTSTLSATALEGLGKPAWECASADELETSTRTMLGRLVPRHRSLRLTDDLTGFHHRKLSLIYPNWEPQREPSVSIILNKKEERKIAPARLDRAIWRDLHYLTAIREGNDANPNAALVLKSHRSELEQELISLWTGALITDLKAKILDVTESTFTVPRNLFGLAGRHRYAAGVEHAETISRKLYGAIKSYGSSMSHENPPIAEGQKHFWHRLDQNHRTLIELAANPQPGQAAIGTPEASDPWTLLVREAALTAYEAVCPHTTPRQIEAYAAGYRSLHKALFPKPKTPKKKVRATN